MGFVGLTYPLLTGIAFVLLLVAAAFGIMRIKIDDSLSQLFRSDTHGIPGNTRR